jgi:hypothetical protein
MEPEGSLPYSQEHASGPNPEPDEYFLPQPYFSRTHFNIIFPSTARSS